MYKSIAVIILLIAAVGFKANMGHSKEDAYSNRETIETINALKGEVLQTGEDGVYMIHCDDRYLDLNAYNLPAKFKKDKLTVTVSGNIKFTNTLEDGWGELFEVTAIK